jgi:drug/metabolite transporter (DMT)-like permease
MGIEGMHPEATASFLIIVSGFTHAIVNAIVKAGRDKMSGRALLDGFSAALMAPVAFFVPLPHGAWLWLAASWLVHAVYLYSTIKGFERLDLSVAYPVARGIAPALASAGAVVLIGEHLTWAAVCGIALVSGGVMALCLGKHLMLRDMRWPVLTGATIAMYTLIDAQGVRAAPDAASYIVWVFIMLGAGIGLLFALWRRREFVASARSQWRSGLTAGALSIVTYGLALYSFRIGDTAKLAALRETSILFAVLIAIFVLKEKATRQRLMAISMIGCGAVLLIVMG